MRVVFDTNIFISALVLPGSQAEKAIQKIIERDTLLISKAIINEVLLVLSRKFSRDPEELSRVAVHLAELGEMVRPAKKVSVLQDEEDNRIIECALGGRADIIVTGDKEILAMKEYGGTGIISLREYLSS
jgi:putative PIN family toxin of toxin-antitoxin system